MTKMLHGEKALADVEAATKALFSGDVRGLDQSMLEEILADVPNTTHDKTLLEAEGVSLVELLPLTSLAQSKREAREFLGNGAVMVNGERIEADRRLTGRDLLHGMTILLRRGKKSWPATRWR